MEERSRAVFLSYCSQDAESARRICEALQSAGIEVWFDPSELRGGDAWDAAIRTQIKTRSLFIPIVSKNTHERGEGYFRLEWKLAVDRSHLMGANLPFLVPVVIDVTNETDDRVPDRFHERLWQDLTGAPSNTIALQTNLGSPMTTPMYSHSVPVFRQLLTALRGILAQADTHAAAKAIPPEALLQARLYPDMFPLIKQVQIAADFARGIAARLGGVEVPAYDGNESSFADLDGLLARTLAFLDSVKAAQFEGSETKEIVLRPGTPKEKKLTGDAYLANYGLPQFFFHVTTAYDILRHNGIAIGKRDYMGAY